jgi:hypothetical protein
MDTCENAATQRSSFCDATRIILLHSAPPIIQYTTPFGYFSHRITCIMRAILMLPIVLLSSLSTTVAFSANRNIAVRQRPHFVARNLWESLPPLRSSPKEQQRLSLDQQLSASSGASIPNTSINLVKSIVGRYVGFEF